MSPPRRLPPEPLPQVAADELAALRAIYMDDFQELETAPTTAWNLPPVRTFSIVLQPTDVDLSDRCKVRLEFSFGARYPATPPNMSIKKIVGVSDAQLAALLDGAKEFAHTRRGQEMIFDIADFIQEQLSRNNAVIRGIKQVSFFEQMQDRREQDEKAEQERADREREQHRLIEEEIMKEQNEMLASQIQEEILKKQAIIKEERERWRKLMVEADLSNGGKMQSKSASPSPTSSEPQMSLDSITKGPLIHRGLLSTLHLAYESLPTPTFLHQQHSAVIKEILVSNSHYLSGEGKKKFLDVCTEIQQKLVSIRHPHIVSIFDSCVLTIPVPKSNVGSPIAPTTPAVTASTVGTHWRLDILLEHCRGGSLQDLIAKSGGVRLSVATRYMKQLLKAVAYLHSLNIIHKDIKTRNVLFGGGSDPDRDIKLADSSYARKLLDLHKTRSLHHGLAEEIRKPKEWMPPELVQRPGVYGRKTDIWSLGTTFLEMIFGPAMYQHACYEELQPKVKIYSNDLSELVSRMLSKDPKDRSTAMELIEDPLFADDAYYDLPVALEIMKSSSTAVRSPANSAYKGPPVPTIPSTPQKSPLARTDEEHNIFEAQTLSRYRLDFEEIEFLGKGGFGEVVKARNRIDGRFYAIKKIKLNPKDREGSKRILREVQTLSRLHHQFVVRYYQAWFEDAAGGTWRDDSEDASESDSESESGSDTDTSATSDTGDMLMDAGFNDDWLSFDDQSKSKGYSNISISFGHGNAGGDDSFCEDDSSDPSPGAKALSPRGIRSDQRAPTTRQPNRVLYIQMEYCEKKTLRDEIDAGVDDEEGWRLFRQVLEGLAHIHSQGMIHRDLKPSNVFLDANGNVKIGDFGLALAREDVAPGATSGSASKLPINGIDMGSVDPEASLTGDVGTPVYVAPEIVGNSGKYNSKVDLYSLGICFFEICYPFSTGMHRALVLRDLRQPSVIFPEDFDNKRFDAQGQLIRLLLNHLPKERPSAVELLQSPLLPPKLEEEYITEALRSIVNQNNPLYYSRLVTSLFKQNTDRHKDFTYDFNSNALNIDQLVGLVTTRFHTHCLRVFGRHGAIEIRTPLLMPKRDDLYCEVAGKKVVELVDSTGCIVHLPYDLTAPFARLISRVSQNVGILPLKRYSIDPVYRCNAVGGQPRTILECDFDIVTSNLGNMCPDAEVIKVVFEMLEFSATKYSNVSDFEIRVNHNILLDKVLDCCNIPSDPAIRTRVCHVLEQLKKPMTWSQVRGHLLAAAQPDQAAGVAGFGAGISADSVTLLEKFHHAEGELHTAVKGIEALIGGHANKASTAASKPSNLQISEVLAQLRLLASHLRHLGIRNRFVLVPLLAYNASHYRGGIMFQIAVAGKKKLDVMAAGGRYDHLLTRFRYPFGPNKKLHAVGVHFALSKAISAIVAEHAAHLRSHSKNTRATNSSNEDLPATPSSASSTKYPPFGATATAHVPRRADVLVVSFGKQGGAFEERMTVISDLWNAGISADMVYHDVESPQDVMQMAEAHGYRLCILVKQQRALLSDTAMSIIKTPSGKPGAASVTSSTSSQAQPQQDVKSGLIKVKNLTTRFETEVSRSDLVSHVHSEIASGSLHHNHYNHYSHHHQQQLPHGSRPHRQLSTGDQSQSASASATSSSSYAFSKDSDVVESGGHDQAGGGGGTAVIDPDRMVVLQAPWKKGKIKHKDKLITIEKAAHSISGEISQLRRGTVFALDLSDSVLRKLCDTDLRIPEDHFRRAFDALPSNQREYLCQVKRQILRHNTETGQKHFWVYSAVDHVSYLYSFE
ncbi:kinase-like domain-containing protein [Powellomyces hirtus]|nr:kinase-like domain-containing protein [Powellomyces hirtus]